MKRSRFPEELDEEEVGLLMPPRIAFSFFGVAAGLAVRSSCTAVFPGGFEETSGMAVFGEAGITGVLAASIFNGVKTGVATGLRVTFVVGTAILGLTTVFGGTAGALILDATDAGVVFGAAAGFKGEVSVCVILGNTESGAVTFAEGFGVADLAVGFAGTDLVPGFVKITGAGLGAAVEAVGAHVDFCASFAEPEVLEVSGDDFFPVEEVPIARVDVIADGFVRGEEEFDFGFLPAGNLAMRGTLNPLPKAVKLHAHFLSESSRCCTGIEDVRLLG